MRLVWKDEAVGKHERWQCQRQWCYEKSVKRDLMNPAGYASKVSTRNRAWFGRDYYEWETGSILHSKVGQLDHITTIRLSRNGSSPSAPPLSVRCLTLRKVEFTDHSFTQCCWIFAKFDRRRFDNCNLFDGAKRCRLVGLLTWPVDAKTSTSIWLCQLMARGAYVHSYATTASQVVGRCGGQWRKGNLSCYRFDVRTIFVWWAFQW